MKVDVLKKQITFKIGSCKLKKVEKCNKFDWRFLMYTIEELAEYISLEDVPSSWTNCFEDIKKQYNSKWLDNYDFDFILTYYEFSDTFKERIYSELNILKKDKKLNLICYIMYFILFLADKSNYYDIWSWESDDKTFKSNGSYMICVISLLCGCKFHIKNIESKNFDDKQIELQKYNIRLTCTNDSVRYGIDGIRFSQMIWGSYFMKGSLIQIGRLQYEVGSDDCDKLDGYFEEKHQYIYIHIPKDNNLKEQDVNESLSLAQKYIKIYYPELKNDKLAYYTETWLLSPEVREILPIDSNIIKFQNKFQIIEYKENTKDFLNFVFNKGYGKVNYNDLPEETTLQKELKARLLNGDKLHLGLGILKTFE